MLVDVLALDGVLDAALGITRDVLAAANRIAVLRGEPAPFQVTLVSPGPTLRTGTGLQVTPERRFSPRARRDVLVVLGLNVPAIDELDAVLTRPDVRRTIAALRGERGRGTLVLAACSGTFLCAEAGLLDEQPAVTSWWLAPSFRRRYPRVGLRDDIMVVAGERIVTAGAALSQADLMLWLVRHVAGPAVAELCARYLVLDERPSQARYLLVEHLQHDSEEVRRADAFARRSLGRDIGVADLARAARTSVRTLERRFEESLGMSPVRYLQRLRAQRALHLLRTTALSLDAIGDRVGYLDSASLRRVLKREAGLSIRQARDRGGRATPGAP